MSYFIFRLCLSILITVVLLVFFIRALRSSGREQCRSPWQIFLPTALALVLTLQITLSAAPKVIDFIYVLRDNLPFQQVSVSSRQALPGMLKTENGRIYNYNPFTSRAEVGKLYNISYTPYSRYIIRIVESEK